jgi:DNA-binding response OmpR family regulator
LQPVKQAGLAVSALIAGDMRTTHLQMIKAGLDDGIMRPLAPERLLAFLRHARRAAGNPSAFGEVSPSALPPIYRFRPIHSTSPSVEGIWH